MNSNVGRLEMICEKCGVENLESAIRCIRCGSALIKPKYILAADENPEYGSAPKPNDKSGFTLAFVLTFVSAWLLGAAFLFLYAGLLPWAPRQWPFFAALLPFAWYIASRT